MHQEIHRPSRENFLNTIQNIKALKVLRKLQFFRSYSKYRPPVWKNRRNNGDIKNHIKLLHEEPAILLHKKQPAKNWHLNNTQANTQNPISNALLQHEPPLFPLHLKYPVTEPDVTCPVPLFTSPFTSTFWPEHFNEAHHLLTEVHSARSNKWATRHNKINTS